MRFHLVLPSAIVALFLAASVPEPAGAGSQPSFVLVVADDLDSRLGSLAVLPTVGRMASDGTSFERFFTPTSLCCPGRTTILRGQYVHDHGVYTNAPPTGGFERFQELTKGRTTIIISHRFPTVRMADRILVVEGGVILEDGTHDELLAASSTYARLYRLQAQGYS